MLIASYPRAAPAEIRNEGPPLQVAPEAVSGEKDAPRIERTEDREFVDTCQYPLPVRILNWFAAIIERLTVFGTENRTANN